MTIASRVALIALMAVAAACQSVEPSVVRGELERAHGLYAEGDYEGAADKIDEILAATSGEPDQFAVQRFYAAFLATQAHLAAACLDEPFLTERSYQGGSPKPSRIAHAMAELLHASNGLAWWESDPAAMSMEDLGGLVPPGLAAEGFEAARTNLHLAMLAAYAALRFDDQARTVLEAPELAAIEERVEQQLSSGTRAEAADVWAEEMKRVSLPESVHPWVYLALFRADDDPRLAFVYGMSALVEGRGPGGLDELTQAEIVDWIDHGTEYEFQCRECGQVIRPRNGETCLTDNEPYLTADYEKRRPKG